MDVALIPLLAASLSLAPQGTDCWPIGNGEDTPVLLATYGQIESQSAGCDRGCDEEHHVIGKFHTAIDLQSEEGEPVFAIHAGVVQEVLESSTDSLWSYILVASDGYPDRGFMYAHLSEIQFGEGQRVEAGELLGFCMAWREPAPSYPCEGAEDYDHVHLAWVMPKFPGDWTKHKQDGGNPLAYIRAPEDDLAPQVHPLSSRGSFHYRKSTDHDEPAGEAVDAPFVGKIDVIASVSDRMGVDARWELAPRTLTLEIRRLDDEDGAVERWDLEFSGQLPGSYYLKGTYACGSVGAHDPTRREFRFVLTNGGGAGAEGIENVAHNNAWDAKEGEYEFTLTVTDFSGNRSVVTERVQVE